MSIDTKKENNLTPDDIEKAERLKSEANEYFKSNIYLLIIVISMGFLWGFDIKSISDLIFVFFFM